MKKLVMALGLALASSIVLAQPPAGNQGGGKAGEGKAGGPRMQKELGLSQEQVEKMRQIRADGGSSEEMRAVLTPEQQAKAAELRGQGKGKGQGNAAGRMKEQLGLSDEQMAQIAQIRKDGGSREQIRAVLTPEQQAQFDQARGKMKRKESQTGQ